MVALAQVQGEASLQGQSRGRITIYCTAETLNRDLLSRKLRARGPNFLLHVRSGAGRRVTCLFPCVDGVIACANCLKRGPQLAL